jgi:hypothetical protein
VYHFGTLMETAMNRIAAVIALAALLPLGGCATPYGYSPGAWAYYDGDYDYGWDGYGGGPVTGYGEATYARPYGNLYYSAPPYYYPGFYYYPGAYGPPFYGYPRGFDRRWDRDYRRGY